MDRTQDLADLQDELAGRNTGKQRRFIPRDQDDAELKAKRAEDEKFQTRMTLAQAEEHLRKIREEASRDEFDRRVYMTRDGQHAFYENGVELSEDEKSNVQWKPGAPSWEDYQEADKNWRAAAGPQKSASHEIMDDKPFPALPSLQAAFRTAGNEKTADAVPALKLDFD